jgi:hypothetical protein
VGKIGRREDAAKDSLRISGWLRRCSYLGIWEVGGFFHWVPSVLTLLSAICRNFESAKLNRQKRDRYAKFSMENLE